MEYSRLPARAKEALWMYMVLDGGVEADEYDAHVLKFTYTLRTYTPRSILQAWKRMGWVKAGTNRKLDLDDEKRVRKIEHLRARGKEVWPYIVASDTRSFKEWASDEMNHGDGYHRMVASVRANQPVEFLFLTQKSRAFHAEESAKQVIRNLIEEPLASWMADS